MTGQTTLMHFTRRARADCFFLRRLRSFDVCSRLLTQFYHTVVASAVFFAAAIWGGGLRKADRDKLNKIVNEVYHLLALFCIIGNVPLLYDEALLVQVHFTSSMYCLMYVIFYEPL